MSQYGISSMEAALLFLIKAIGDKATPAEITRWFIRESHTVSETLSRMESKGLVRKVKDLERKNLVRVILTEKGEQAYNQADKRESIHQIMASLSKEQRQQLKSCLEILREEALKELGIDRKAVFP